MILREGDDEEVATLPTRVTAAPNRSLPEERSFVEPRLAHLLGLAEVTTGDRQDLFAAWRMFFERLARSAPTVLAFEDLRWADSSLLDFVEYLLEWSRDYPIYVLTLARPELQERRPSWGAGQRNLTSLYLEPLSPLAMEELLDGLVPGLPADLRTQILGRAEGAPAGGGDCGPRGRRTACSISWDFRRAAVGFVTGATMANFTCLAAARSSVLSRVAWDVGRDGLFGAPRPHILVGAERHETVDLALRYLGLGNRSRLPRTTRDESGSTPSPSRSTNLPAPAQ